MLAENPDLKAPAGGLNRVYYGGVQIELGLHPEVKTAERISGFQNYGSIHVEPTDQQLLLQGNDTILFNVVSCVSEHLSIQGTPTLNENKYLLPGSRYLGTCT